MKHLPIAGLAAALLAGCASVPPVDPPTEAPPPAAWQAPAAAAGTRSAELARWWQQFDDPLLAALIDRAQVQSPSLAAARTRIAQARATQAGASAALAPRLDATASAQRGRFEPSVPLASTRSAGLQASWEIDLFGANSAARDAASARLASAEAGWHDARISVAAEVAGAYLGLRACEAQRTLTRSDAASRNETARLNDLAANAGIQSPANAALARASAAQGRSLATQQAALCDSAVKGLVALTATDEPALRAELAGATARLPQPAQLGVASVPAEALAQRPDLIAAEREWLAAASDVAGAERQKLPRVALSGNIAAARVASGGFTDSGSVWSIGPLSVSLPIFDGGTLAANADAARVRLDEARTGYRATLRQAVREVEDALIALHATAARNDDARIAAEGFDASYRATEARQRSGLASLFELEDARRSALVAQSVLIDLQRERVAAWVALYRALGGGWQASDTPTVAIKNIP